MKNKLNQEFTAKDIIKLRKSYGLKQGDLAKALNIKQATLSRYENGAYIPPHIHKLLNFYKKLKELQAL